MTVVGQNKDRWLEAAQKEYQDMSRQLGTQWILEEAQMLCWQLPTQKKEKSRRMCTKPGRVRSETYQICVVENTK